jgi:NTE family protein
MRLNILLFLSLALFWSGCVQENRYDSLQGETLEEIQEIYPLQDNKTIKLGIAFGGGGVRGFVHLGVIQALEEAGIQAEIVTGTSAGAIAAVLYASELPLQQIRQEMIELERWDVTDPVLSLNGLIQGRKLAFWINQILGNKRLSELPKKVGVAVTELVDSQLLLVVEGKAGEAVQASSSIPGTFVPVKVDQEIWVDGGVLSVVPVRFARALGAHKVLAIDTFCGRGYPVSENAFWTTTQAFRLQMCSGNKSELLEADWLLRPDFEPKDFLSFEERDVAIQAGYEAMKELLPTIKAELANGN